MDATLRSKNSVKRNFTAKIAEIDAALAEPTTTAVRLRTLHTQIQKKWEVLDKWYDEIQALVMETEGDANSLDLLDRETTEREGVRDEWIRIDNEVQAMLNPIQPATQQVPVRKSNIKLAELKIQPFDGDELMWREF